jgi:hypothetical protein
MTVQQGGRMADDSAAKKTGTATGATVAAYSVGQQIAIGALTFGIGFVALVFIFRVRSFKEVIALGREDRAGETTRRAQPAPSSEPL